MPLIIIVILVIVAAVYASKADTKGDDGPLPHNTDWDNT